MMKTFAYIVFGLIALLLVSSVAWMEWFIELPQMWRLGLAIGVAAVFTVAIVVAVEDQKQ